MDSQTLVKTLQRVAEDIRHLGKNFNLLMLVPSDALSADSTFTVIASAQWLDLMSPSAAVDLMLQKITEAAGDDRNAVVAQVSRVTVIRTLDPVVAAITSGFNVSGSSVNLTNCNINGLVVPAAIIVEAHKPTTPVQPGRAGRNDPCICGSGKKFKKCCGG